MTLSLRNKEKTTCLSCNGTYFSWQIAKHKAICPEFKVFMKKNKGKLTDILSTKEETPE